ncbi:Uu.00g036610.m01.CDS01 [Anthostomella pinea]|uniref:Uu.00g036610.m01.CDS01 n=1 Tax=Anthostomella pinea TaxID=933095 RepID=A0AAI8YDP9_9PEZI|nr:Uu.00g036610.m01.CDS01 [Anthostomella pinea]
MSKANAERMLRYFDHFSIIAMINECLQTPLESGTLWRCPLPSDLYDSFATGDLSQTYDRPDLTRDEETLVQLMSENFFKWYLEEDKDKLDNYHLVQADPITKFLDQATRQGKGEDVTKTTRKLLFKNDYKDEDVKKATSLWQKGTVMSDDFLGMLEATPGSQGLVTRMTKLDESRLEVLTNWKRNDALSINDIYQGMQKMRKGGPTQAAKAAAASVGIGGINNDFHTRSFIYIIYSQSGRILSLFNNEAEYRELLFVDGIAGKFKVLGYQKLQGFKDKQKIYSEGHYAVFWMVETGVEISDKAIKDNKKLLSDLKSEVKL